MHAPPQRSHDCCAVCRPLLPALHCQQRVLVYNGHSMPAFVTLSSSLPLSYLVTDPSARAFMLPCPT